jgi:hypothetical protein
MEAVRVRLLARVPVGTVAEADSVRPENGVGVTKMGVASISKVALNVGVTVVRKRFVLQAARKDKTRVAENNKNKPKNFLFIFSHR